MQVFIFSKLILSYDDYGRPKGAIGLHNRQDRIGRCLPKYPMTPRELSVMKRTTVTE